MSKKTLIESLFKTFASTKTPLTKRLCTSVCDSVFAHITNALKTGGRFSYPNFGSLIVRGTKSRSCLANLHELKNDPNIARVYKTMDASRRVKFSPSSNVQKDLSSFKEYSRV
eukprot:TRINITY_DN8340_c0_g1_i4.p1 TRINITY_DN8340_c0_g1~~TRINITY_DN8340_c0_g1_i4.p1  ORF type:complete len:113 (-),score=8.45 TRINITY_DN8340_c0_g1_i4:80-418(-)